MKLTKRQIRIIEQFIELGDDLYLKEGDDLHDISITTEVFECISMLYDIYKYECEPNS